MMDGVNPSDAIGEVDHESAGDAADAVENQEAAEGAESSGRLGSRSGLQEALLSTDPSTRLEDVDSPWNPEAGGVARIYRGLQKMLNFDGTPAIVDVVIGAFEAIKNFEPAGGEDDAGDRDDGGKDLA